MRHLLLVFGIGFFIFGYKAFSSSENWNTEYDSFIFFAGILLMMAWAEVNIKKLKENN